MQPRLDRKPVMGAPWREKILTVMTMRTTMRAPCGIADARSSTFLARKNKAHRQISCTYRPTKTWLMAFGKNLPPVSVDFG